MNESTPPLAEPMPYNAETGEIIPSESSGLPGGMAQTALGNSAIKVLMSTPILKPRNTAMLRTRLSALCAENADKYIYSWVVKDKKRGRETLVEGLSIKGAMDLVRVYGNCFVGPLDIEDRGDNWLFTAILFDRETGSITMRSHLQRKSQNLGMRDAARAQEMIFNSGQSKAVRNVIVNHFGADAAFMVETCRRGGLAQWVQNNPDKADLFIDETTDAHAIEMNRIEASVGKKRAQWTHREIARIMMELRAIDDAMISAESAFPLLEAGEDLKAEVQPTPKQEEKSATKTATPKETAKKEPETAKEAKPAAQKGRGRPKMTEEEKAKAKAEREAKKNGPQKSAVEDDDSSEAPEDQSEAESSPAPSEEPPEASEPEESDQGSLGEGWDFD
jgi:hypothetical protein